MGRSADSTIASGVAVPYLFSRSFSSEPPFFFFNDTATTEIYTLSLHDALPIYTKCPCVLILTSASMFSIDTTCARRSEEHTSELQSQSNLVCRLLLEKKCSGSSTCASRRSISVTISTKLSTSRRPQVGQATTVT